MEVACWVARVAVFPRGWRLLAPGDDDGLAQGGGGNQSVGSQVGEDLDTRTSAIWNLNTNLKRAKARFQGVFPLIIPSTLECMGKQKLAVVLSRTIDFTPLLAAWQL